MGDREYTAAEKAACAKRELAMRLKAYPNWVKQGRITQEQADKEIAVMRAIAEDYDKLVQPRLLG